MEIKIVIFLAVLATVKSEQEHLKPSEDSSPIGYSHVISHVVHHDAPETASQAEIYHAPSNQQEIGLHPLETTNSYAKPLDTANTNTISSSINMNSDPSPSTPPMFYPYISSQPEIGSGKIPMGKPRFTTPGLSAYASMTIDDSYKDSIISDTPIQSEMPYSGI